MSACEHGGYVDVGDGWPCPCERCTSAVTRVRDADRWFDAWVCVGLGMLWHSDRTHSAGFAAFGIAVLIGVAAWLQILMARAALGTDD
jgi:hypothetical protein